MKAGVTYGKARTLCVTKENMYLALKTSLISEKWESEQRRGIDLVEKTKLRNRHVVTLIGLKAAREGNKIFTILSIILKSNWAY